MYIGFAPNERTVIIVYISLALSVFPSLLAQPPSLEVMTDSLASVEIGNAHVGIALHGNRPLPQRISFYSPVANSIDLSTDYWTRDRTFNTAVGLKTGEGPYRWVGTDPFPLRLTPYRAVYSASTATERIDIRYEFSDRSPVMFVTYVITNLREEPETFEWYTHLEATVRTSHTFDIKSTTSARFLTQGKAIVHAYQDPETAFAELFVSNVGWMPSEHSAFSHMSTLPTPEQWWLSLGAAPMQTRMDTGTVARPAFRYLYRSLLQPGESMTIRQVVGSAAKGTSAEWIDRLATTWEDEIRGHERAVLGYADRNRFITGDETLDHSVRWANAILDVNRHHIDGSIQPMPCPAEYNFYFTHDVLKTDLAVVNFDTDRVKRDLEFILSLAGDDFVIPHAYYWKDTRFATEFATPDNWNHFWFVIVAGTYLRHSNDLALISRMVPYLEKSVSEFMTHLDEGMIHSYRPDWWDIARNYGPRSYTTILADKALREFSYITSRLNPADARLPRFEADSKHMREGLNDSLWDPNRKYYMNVFSDGTLDTHYYQGSLLAAHYGLADTSRIRELVGTAKQTLLDPKIGVYTVFPMDFQLLIGYLNLVGNEAGDAHTYLNGGIWPHGNAWYAMALLAAGEHDEAADHIRSVMTVKGVMDSPNGYPAMYEYRVSDRNNPARYGKIDKPQFMWAAGWYLYSLYQLHGIRESEWNIRFAPYLSDPERPVRFDLMSAGKELDVHVSGKGTRIGRIRVNGQESATAVLPDTTIGGAGSVDIELGRLTSPMLMELGAVLREARYESRTKRLFVSHSSFVDHEVTMEIHAPSMPKQIRVNGKRIRQWTAHRLEDRVVIRLSSTQSAEKDLVELRF